MFINDLKVYLSVTKIAFCINISLSKTKVTNQSTNMKGHNPMANNNNGLMQPKDTASTTPITDKLKSMLSPASKTPLSLEEKLSNLSQSELNTVTSQAKIAHLSSKLTAKFHGAPPQTYGELLSSMYPKGDRNLQSIVTEVLQASDPIAEEDIVRRYKEKPSYDREAIAQMYVNQLKPTDEDVKKFTEDAGLNDQTLYGK